ncbi:hypothetical protein NL676_029215 [Syzygium grande]|nr:hypothetical protein NL676_029215 [Syzygium grande]
MRERGQGKHVAPTKGVLRLASLLAGPLLPSHVTPSQDGDASPTFAVGKGSFVVFLPARAQPALCPNEGPTRLLANYGISRSIRERGGRKVALPYTRTRPPFFFWQRSRPPPPHPGLVFPTRHLKIE